jgi:hypothetical protein
MWRRSISARRLVALATSLVGPGCFTRDYLDDLDGGEATSGERSTEDDAGSSAGEDEDSGADTEESAESSSAASDDGSSTGGETTIDAPDAGGANQPCDTFAQDCPLGEKCMPWADGGATWNANKCMPVAAHPHEPGDGCTALGGGTSGLDDCASASMCWDVDLETNTGTCVAFCTGSLEMPVCDDAATTCIVANGGVLAVCLPTCDPLAQNCPDADDGCYPAGDAFACAPDASDSEGSYGDPCEFINVCDPGLVCTDGDRVPACASTACCSQLCDLSQPNPAAQCSGEAQGQDCIPWFEPAEAPVGFEDVGLCALP